MVKEYTILDMWKADYFVNPDYFSDDFIIYKNIGKEFTQNKALQEVYFHNSYKVSSSSFILCMDGTSEMEIDSMKYTINKHHLLVILPNQIIKCISTSDDFSAHLIIISSKYFDSRDNFYKTMSLLIPLKNHPTAILSPDEMELLKSYHSLICRKISEDDNLLRDFTIQYLIQAIFYEVCRLLLKHTDIKRSNLSHKEEIFKHFIKLVEDHHYKERDITFYAKELCLTPKYLSSIIHDTTGKHAGEWIDNYVIIEAKALLISSCMTIQEICYELNFSSPSSFTRFFKRITGMSPREFRTHKEFPKLI